MSLLSLFFLLFFINISNSLQFCQESCSRTGLVIRFPFGLTGTSCSYESYFNLSCTGGGQTILNLPLSGNFLVQYIDYRYQKIHIRDPGNCFPERYFFNNFSLSGSPFARELHGTFTYLNCSSDVSFPSSYRRINCLSSDSFTVVAIPHTYDQANQTVVSASPCKVMSDSVFAPVSWHQRDEGVAALTWTEPDCRNCEQRGGICGYKDDVGSEVGCYYYDQPNDKHALPRSAKYGMIIGIGIPGLLCIIGLGCYLCGRVRSYRHSHSSRRSELITTIPHQPSVVTAGLDGPTLELYPKTLLGASRRLPKPNDNTCSICLSEYQPKETLRTIPECNHYFHSECVDAWLKMNATCPVCRNSPDASLSASSIATTPSSSLSASSSSLYSGP
ncbi:putative RING-H2 finger protein ATL21B [Mercurialis annua]|uniref:putative RING-H2 finger protein ATL21B n=1 Tax=Mercurialis annua TaxID=3986 RepID=UPI00215F51D4|nr:putative RING-H2 finger protein ATL21B [Mercurialis annua]